MSSYKEIWGQKIQTIAGDPSVAIAGQLWYNSTAATVKGNVFYNGVWATGSATMNNGRKMMAGGITLTPPGAQANQNATETFNGTTWTTIP